jgi:transposase
MDRAELQALLAEGFSLAEIGRRHGLHESTVGYWVGKHGLKAVGQEKHAARGGLGREDLRALVDAGASIAQIADATDRSKATVRHWLKRYGLKTGAGAGRRPREGVLDARAAGASEVALTCARHGTTMHVRDAKGSYRCPRCRAEAVVRRRQKVKQTLVEEAGGCCQICGYDRCLAALEFHHLDPERKEFGLARRGAHSLEKLRLETGKCVLLCSNCHAEVEAGARTLS